MTFGIEGKVVVITGASSGLGAESARALVKAGAKVVLGARRRERLEQLAQDLGEAQCAVRVCDVTDRAQVQALVDLAVQRFGRIDVMVNNAGVMPLAPLEMLRVDEWDECLDVNVKGVLWGVAAALPHFKAQKSGQFVSVASVAAHVVGPGSAVYSASKAAVRMLSEGLRQEVKPYGIRTTVISPGAVDTELPSSVKAAGVSEAVGEFYKQVAIPASSFAQCLLFAIAQPPAVDINEILFRPTQQQL